MYEIGHCWTGVKPRENLTTSCPRLDPLVSPSKDRSINRYCYPEEPSYLANGSIEIDEFGNPVMWPMGWMDIPEILIGTNYGDLSKSLAKFHFTGYLQKFFLQRPFYSSCFLRRKTFLGIRKIILNV